MRFRAGYTYKCTRAGKDFFMIIKKRANGKIWGEIHEVEKGKHAMCFYGHLPDDYIDAIGKWGASGAKIDCQKVREL